jgi:hypothetical protein
MIFSRLDSLIPMHVPHAPTSNVKAVPHLPQCAIYASATIETSQMHANVWKVIRIHL